MSAKIGLPKTDWTLSVPQIAVAFAVVLGIFTSIFGVWTATSVWGFPLFVVAVVVLIYFPGKFLLDFATLRPRPLEDLTLSLVLGMIVSSSLYWISGFLALPYVFPLWPLAAAAVYFHRRRKRWHEIRRLRVAFDVSHILLLGLIIVSLIPLAAMPMYYRNLDLLPGNSMTYAKRPFDFVVHLSFAYELTHSVPPQVPYLAGRPMTYHHGMDLLVAMLGEIGHISIPDLTVRFVPTFALALTVLAVFCLGRIWLHSHYGAVLTAFLVVFGEDLSFIPGLLLNVRGIWSDWFFGVSTTYSLYFFNPMLLGLAILFSALFCLKKFCEGERKFWLILASLLIAVLVDYKVFITAHVLIGLAMTGSIYFVLHRDLRMLKVLGLALLLMAPLLLVYGHADVQAGLASSVRLEPWPYIPNALEDLGLSNTALGDHVNGLFEGELANFSNLAAFFLVALPVYLLGSLGLRIVAVPALVRELWLPRPSTVVGFFLACFCIIGPVITLTWRVIPQGYSPESEYNNSVWFYMQSKYVVWVFVTESVLTLCRGKRRRWQALMVATVVILTIPSSVQYFQRQMGRQLLTLEASEVEAIDYLKPACSEGQVVLARGEVAEHVVALTACRVPLLDKPGYLHYFAPSNEVAQRFADQNGFWQAWNTGELQFRILERYKVAYVVVDKRAGDLVPSQDHSWVGEDRSTEEEPGFIGSYFENDDFIIYGVSLPTD